MKLILKNKINELIEKFFQVIYDASNDDTEYLESLKIIKRLLKLEIHNSKRIKK